MASTDKIQVIRLQEWDDAEIAHTPRNGPVNPLRRLARRGRAKYGRMWVSGVVCAIVVTVALIIGLSVGLATHGKKYQISLVNATFNTSADMDSTRIPQFPSKGTRYDGDLTYYSVGLGACGITSSDSQAVVAISEQVFDAASTSANPNANPLCGRQIRAQRFDPTRGATHSVDLTVVDRCTGCKPDDLDVSISVFEQLARITQGRVDVTWAWLPD